jgi:hypothetical protein
MLDVAAFAWERAHGLLRWNGVFHGAQRMRYKALFTAAMMIAGLSLAEAQTGGSAGNPAGGTSSGNAGAATGTSPSTSGGGNTGVSSGRSDSMGPSGGPATGESGRTRQGQQGQDGGKK